MKNLLNSTILVIFQLAFSHFALFYIPYYTTLYISSSFARFAFWSLHNVNNNNNNAPLFLYAHNNESEIEISLWWLLFDSFLFFHNLFFFLSYVSTSTLWSLINILNKKIRKSEIKMNKCMNHCVLWLGNSYCSMHNIWLRIWFLLLYIRLLIGTGGGGRQYCRHPLKSIRQSRIYMFICRHDEQCNASMISSYRLLVEWYDK